MCPWTLHPVRASYASRRVRRLVGPAWTVTVLLAAGLNVARAQTEMSPPAAPAPVNPVPAAAETPGPGGEGGAAPPPVAGSSEGSPTPAALGDRLYLSPAEIEKMIDKAIQAHDEKKKKEEEEKKKEEARKKEEEWYAIGSNLGMTAKWQHGVWFATPHNDFRFHVGGAVQYDLALYSVSEQVQFGPGGTGPFDDGVNLRRGRLRAEGSFHELLDFLFELEFFNGVEVTNARIDQARSRTFNAPGPTDAHLTINQLPVIGHVRIGSMKEPFGLEHLNSYRYLEFMERSYLFDAFTPTAFNNGFTPGIMAFNTMCDERATWWLGIFKNDTSLFGFGLGDGKYAVTGRLTGLPLYEADGACLVHLGVAGSHRDPVNEQVQIRVRDEVRNAPFPLLPLIANTGLINTSSQDLVNIEHAAVWGPVTVQAEYSATRLSNASQPPNLVIPGTYYAQGAYGEVLVFLTGERRPWDRKTATFTRVVPHAPFFWVPGQGHWICGPGAWEVGVRYTWLDTTNMGIRGGQLNDVTLGLNWYLNANAKIQWNYDIARRGEVPGDSSGFIQAFGMRMAMDF